MKGEVVIVPPEGAPSLYKPQYCQMLRDHLAQGHSYKTFVNYVINPTTNQPIDVGTLYDWEAAHPEFANAKEQGNELRVELYESFARNIAGGIIPPPPKPTDPGAGVPMMTRGNAAMTMFMLCNIAPERYRNRWYRDDGGAGGSGGSDPDNIEKAPIINFNLTRLPAPSKPEGEQNE